MLLLRYFEILQLPGSVGPLPVHKCGGPNLCSRSSTFELSIQARIAQDRPTSNLIEEGKKAP